MILPSRWTISALVSLLLPFFKLALHFIVPCNISSYGWSDFSLNDDGFTGIPLFDKACSIFRLYLYQAYVYSNYTTASCQTIGF